MAGEAVANEPRLFVGQIPADCTEEELWPLFSPYGTVRNLHILRGPDSKPRGCAMVLYARWSQAEAAADSLDGATALNGGQGRPLVVHFANPRKVPPGQPSEAGLAPKKLFVGQVPRDVTEDMLRPFFEPYGDIEHINILRTQRGQSAGCGFIQFSRWAHAEAAMEAHNGKTRLGNSDVPLVVKFADAKRRDQQAQNLGMGLRGPGWMGDLKHLQDPSAYGDLGYQLGGQQWPNQGLVHQGNHMLGNSLLSNQLAQMQHLVAQNYPGPYHAQHSQYMQDPSYMHLGHMQEKAPPLGNRLQESQFSVGSNLGSNASDSAIASQLLNNAANLGSSINIPQGSMSAAGSTAQVGSLPSTSTADLAKQLNDLSLAKLEGQSADGRSDGPFNAQPQGMQHHRPDVQGLYLQNMGNVPHMGRMGSGPYSNQLLNLPRGGPFAGNMGRPWGQKIGSNDRFNEWKLFVGQVPLEASEEDIWSLFSPVGQILELYILRNNNGKSRGCAFVTYASKQLAEQAITQLNGRQMPSGKILVVKFADRANANKSSPAGLLNMNLYSPQ